MLTSSGSVSPDRPRGLAVVLLCAASLAAPCLAAPCLATAPAVASGSPLTTADEGDDDYTYARGLYKSGRHQQAAVAFDAFLRKYPDHARGPVARLYYGLTLSNLDRYTEAREQFRTFARENPTNRNYPDALYRIGECSYYLRDYEAAESQLRTFREKYPQHSLVNWAYLFEGDSQVAQQKWSDAEATFQRLLSNNPEEQTRRDAEYGMARAYEGLAEVNKAFNLYVKLVSAKDPAVSPRALARMGGIYFRSGDFDEAVKAYSRIDQLYSQHALAPSARLNTGLALYRSGDYENAIRWLQRSAEDSRSAARARLLHGLCLQKQEQYVEADKLLAAAAVTHRSNPLAANMVYYRADGKRVTGAPAEAVGLFEQLVKDWPQSEFVDDSLFFAADAAMQLNDVTKAAQLLDRLDRDFPENNFGDRSHLLRGRVAAASGEDTDLRRAIDEFRKATETAQSDRTRTLGSYYLARTWQQLRDHEKALTAAAPLLTTDDGNLAEDLGGIYVLCSVSSLALEQYEKARDFAGDYLTRYPAGDRRVDAYEARAIAQAHLGNREAADTDLAALEKLSSDATRKRDALRRLAEVAWEAKRWDWSTALFKRLSADRDSALRPAGLSGYAWSLFQQDEFAEAATAFQTLATDHPEHKLAAEASYMRAEALRKANKPDDAVLAYMEVFNRLAPPSPAAAGAELTNPGRYAFEAARHAVRLYEQLNQRPQADAAYTALTQRFPNAARIDQILDQWAFMHLEAEDYARADEIFQRLVETCPTSPLVPNARLSLAESDLEAGRDAEANLTFVELKDNASAPADVREAALFHLVSLASTSGSEDLAGYCQEYLETFASGRYRDQVELAQAESLFQRQQISEAQTILEGLRTRVVDSGQFQEDQGRIWVVLAETFLRQKDYAQVRTLASELLTRGEWSKFHYQMNEVVGRSYKQQAPPDFDKAREAFRKVVIDPIGRGTATAAKSQFLLADTWLAQEEYGRALEAYLRVYINYKGIPEWQSAGLYQAARCDEALQDYTNALKSYRDLAQEFPGSRYAAEALKKIPELEARLQDKRP